MTKHFEVVAVYADGHRLVVRYAENWRRARALLREQAHERPGVPMVIRRVKPEARWILGAYSYRTIREIERAFPRLWRGGEKP